MAWRDQDWYVAPHVAQGSWDTCALSFAPFNYVGVSPVQPHHLRRIAPRCLVPLCRQVWCTSTDTLGPRALTFMRSKRSSQHGESLVTARRISLCPLVHFALYATLIFLCYLRPAAQLTTIIPFSLPVQSLSLLLDIHSHR